MRNNSSKLEVDKFFPGMKLSFEKRGISNKFLYNIDADGLNSASANSNNLSLGASMEELKLKYFGKSDIKGGPHSDTINDKEEEQVFTDDAHPEPPKVSNTEHLDVSLIEPEGNNNADNNSIVGKKTVISQNGKPLAAQG